MTVTSPPLRLGFLGELLLYLHFRGQIHYRVEERFGGEGEEDADSNRNPDEAKKP